MNIEPRGQLHQGLFALDRSQCHFGLKYRRMIAAGSLRHGSPSFQAISSLVMDGVATYPVASRSGASSVGWAMENHLRTELVLEALQNAISQRRPQDVIHHSDRGCQYTSYAFGKRCREAGVMPSIGSVGDCYDNAMAESFWATLEREVLSRRRFKTQAEAKMAIFSWIEGWYNPHRRHSSLGRRSPMNYERHALEHRAA